MNQHWKNLTSIDAIAADLAGNASAADPGSMLQDARDAIARVIELVTSPRPMDTAPTDGSDVLLFVPTEEPRFVVGYWAAWGGWDYREELIMNVATGTLVPAGWLPLPRETLLPVEGSLR